MAAIFRGASGGTAGVGDTERYSAFISYSHSDGGVARWLHRAIEGYRFPKALRGEETEFGPVPFKLPPVFRDRDELAASGDLGAELRVALGAARFQVVLCSPRAAQSKWVNEEILAFKRTHGEHRTLALIVDGEPYAGREEECFPPALRYRLAPDGTLSDEPAEPIAADIRKGKDGKRLALLKLLAGISGTRLDQLVRRDAARRQRRLAFLAAGSGLVALTTIGLAIYAESQRRVAVEQRNLAEASLTFLTGTFEIANPATENPKTITALTVLDRASSRAVREFADKPRIAASLLRTTGEIYYNLGLPDQSERNLLTALRLEPNAGEARARTLLLLAAVAKQRTDPAAAASHVKEAEQALIGTQIEDREIGALLNEHRGDVAFLQGDYAVAANYYAQSVRQFQGLGAASVSDDVVRLLSNRARSLTRIGKSADATALFEQAARIALSAHGAQDVRFARATQNLAYARYNEGDVVGAIRPMRQALAAYFRVLEPDHPTMGAAFLLSGRIAAATGSLAEARSNFSRARAIQLKLNGADNPAVADVDFYTADAEGSAGNTELALAIADRVETIYDAAYGQDDPDQAELLLLRSRILAKAGRNGEAGEACRRALSLQRKLGLSSDQIGETRATCEVNKR